MSSPSTRRSALAAKLGQPQSHCWTLCFRLDSLLRAFVTYVVFLDHHRQQMWQHGLQLSVAVYYKISRSCRYRQNAAHRTEHVLHPLDDNPWQGEYESEPRGGDGQLRNSVVWDGFGLVTLLLV